MLDLITPFTLTPLKYYGTWLLIAVMAACFIIEVKLRMDERKRSDHFEDKCEKYAKIEHDLQVDVANALTEITKKDSELRTLRDSYNSLNISMADALNEKRDLADMNLALIKDNGRLLNEQRDLVAENDRLTKCFARASDELVALNYQVAQEVKKSDRVVVKKKMIR